MIRKLSTLLFILIPLLFLIVFWQNNLSKNPWQYDLSEGTFSNIYGRQSAGIETTAATQFTYFYYYLNLYPLISTHPITDFSPQGAIDIIKNYPDSLAYDTGSHIDWGIYFSNTLLLLAAHLKGTALDVSLVSINKIFFIFALLLLLISFWLHKKRFLGISLVILLGSSLHQLYEVYGRSNIFSYNLDLFIICIALTLPIIYSKAKYLKYYVYLISFILGSLFWTFAHLRTEVMTGLLPLILFLIFTHNLKRQVKAVSFLILLVGIVMVHFYWASYYKALFSRTFSLIEPLRDNTTFIKPPSTYHNVLWHALAVGMADIKQEHGYTDLLDYSQTEYARQELITNNFENFSQMSQNKWMTTPEHAEIMKRRVMNDITHDPLWYLSILTGRVKVMCTKLPPVTISFGSHIFSSHVSGYIFIPALLLFIFVRDYKRLLILISSLANSITTVFITTAWNTHYMAIFHLFALALLADYIQERILRTKFVFITNKLQWLYSWSQMMKTALINIKLSKFNR